MMRSKFVLHAPVEGWGNSVRNRRAARKGLRTKRLRSAPRAARDSGARDRAHQRDAPAELAEPEPRIKPLRRGISEIDRARDRLGAHAVERGEAHREQRSAEAAAAELRRNPEVDELDRAVLGAVVEK